MSIAGTQAGDCDNDLKDLARECQQYVMEPPNPKTPPSSACCGVVQKVNVPCACSKVTKETEKLVCMENVVYVANECKRPFPPGYQCGTGQPEEVPSQACYDTYQKLDMSFMCSKVHKGIEQIISMPKGRVHHRLLQKASHVGHQV
ncbi:hypothetical protein HU200_012218 [Digitaria exilis]|uniref:Bifunctional inhibitor/plant lipid transfer protein/seed storage helical domain-containing protein n=1 Tax=Digitaria exilis TaxID=1010633 RepID=A0A835FFX9_9POAL|nr:hypothetical protein HU200_012218 [Digitaria exilis]